MIYLLIHAEGVPVPARNALVAASSAEPATRKELLQSAARILYAETELECEDLRELVSLVPDCGCE